MSEIKHDRARFLHKQSNCVSIYGVEIAKEYVTVVFDHCIDEIVTFLFPKGEREELRRREAKQDGMYRGRRLDDK